MKKQGISILILVTCVFAAFTLGFFVGRNQNHSTVTISQNATTAPTPAAEAEETTGSQTKPTESPAVVPASTGNKININTATQTELMTLPGIGEVIAQRIIDYRSEHGDFRTVEDLLNVSGIGEKRLEAILDLVTVGG